ALEHDIHRLFAGRGRQHNVRDAGGVRRNRTARYRGDAQGRRVRQEHRSGRITDVGRVGVAAEGDRLAFDADTAVGAAVLGRITCSSATLAARIAVVDAATLGIQIAVTLHFARHQANCTAGTTSTLATDIRAGDATTVTTTGIDASGDTQGAGRGHKDGPAAAAAAGSGIVRATTPAATARATQKRLQEFVAVSLREWPVVVRAIVPGRRLVDIESVRATSTYVLPVTRRGVAVVIALDSSSSAAGTKPRAATDDGCTQLLVIATTATAIEATRTTLPGNTVVAEIAVPIGASGLGVLSGYVDGTSNGHVPAGEQVHRGIGRVPAELHGHACGDIDRGVIEDPGFGKLDLGIHGRIERTVGARAPAIESQDRWNAEPHAQGGDKRCAGERCHVFHDLFLSLVCVSGMLRKGSATLAGDHPRKPRAARAA